MTIEAETTGANPTAAQKQGDRELVITRVFDAPPATVFRAWSDAKLFQRWWVPSSAPITLVSCDIDMRTGGTYRLEFGAGDQTMAFYGKYLEVVPNEKIVWTNDEAHDGGEEGAVTTVTFTEQGGRTHLTFHEAYPTPEALQEALEGSAEALPEQLEQLAGVVAELAA